MSGVLKNLFERAVLSQASSHIIIPKSVYAGFDPTADSLHLGHLSVLSTLFRFNIHGHNIVALIGDVTASMGDPMFRVSERSLIAKSQILDNSKHIESQIATLMNNIGNSAERNGAGEYDPRRLKIRRNSEWLANLSAIEYISLYGKHFQAKYMMSHEGMMARLNSDAGLSYRELSYQILQAIDFCNLYQSDSVNTQLGGNDQWGNICSGLHLAGRLFNEEKFLGLTVGLITDKNGKKIGKSDGCTLWLDRSKTSPFDIYQYVYNLDKETSKKIAKAITFLKNDSIDDIFGSEDNSYQEIVAKEITSLIHGEIAGEQAASLSRDLARLYSSTTYEDLETVLSPARTTVLKLEKDEGHLLIDLLAHISSKPSKSELKRVVTSGGLYINFKKVTTSQLFEPISLRSTPVMLVSFGRNSPYLLKIDQKNMA